MKRSVDELKDDVAGLENSLEEWAPIMVKIMKMMETLTTQVQSHQRQLDMCDIRELQKEASGKLDRLATVQQQTFQLVKSLRSHKKQTSSG